MSPFEKAKIAAAACCHRLIAEERAALSASAPSQSDRAISNGLIKALDKAAEDIMALKESE